MWGLVINPRAENNDSSSPSLTAKTVDIQSDSHSHATLCYAGDAESVRVKSLTANTSSSISSATFHAAQQQGASHHRLLDSSALALPSRITPGSSLPTGPYSTLTHHRIQPSKSRSITPRSFHSSMQRQAQPLSQTATARVPQRFAGFSSPRSTERPPLRTGMNWNERKNDLTERSVAYPPAPLSQGLIEEDEGPELCQAPFTLETAAELTNTEKKALATFRAWKQQRENAPPPTDGTKSVRNNASSMSLFALQPLTSEENASPAEARRATSALLLQLVMDLSVRPSSSAPHRMGMSAAEDDRTARLDCYVDQVAQWFVEHIEALRLHGHNTLDGDVEAPEQCSSTPWMPFSCDSSGKTKQRIFLPLLLQLIPLYIRHGVLRQLSDVQRWVLRLFLRLGQGLQLIRVEQEEKKLCSFNWNRHGRQHNTSQRQRDRRKTNIPQEKKRERRATFSWNGEGCEWERMLKVFGAAAAGSRLAQDALAKEFTALELSSGHPHPETTAPPSSSSSRLSYQRAPSSCYSLTSLMEEFVTLIVTLQEQREGPLSKSAWGSPPTSSHALIEPARAVLQPPFSKESKTEGLSTSTTAKGASTIQNPVQKNPMSRDTRTFSRLGPLKPCSNVSLMKELPHPSQPWCFFAASCVGDILNALLVTPPATCTQVPRQQSRGPIPMNPNVPNTRCEEAEASSGWEASGSFQSSCSSSPCGTPNSVSRSSSSAVMEQVRDPLLSPSNSISCWSSGCSSNGSSTGMEADLLVEPTEETKSLEASEREQQEGVQEKLPESATEGVAALHEEGVAEEIVKRRSKKSSKKGNSDHYGNRDPQRLRRRMETPLLCDASLESVFVSSGKPSLEEAFLWLCWTLQRHPCYQSPFDAVATNSPSHEAPSTRHHQGVVDSHPKTVPPGAPLQSPCDSSLSFPSASGVPPTSSSLKRCPVSLAVPPARAHTAEDVGGSPTAASRLFRSRGAYQERCRLAELWRTIWSQLLAASMKVPAARSFVPFERHSSGADEVEDGEVDEEMEVSFSLWDSWKLGRAEGRKRRRPRDPTRPADASREKDGAIGKGEGSWRSFLPWSVQRRSSRRRREHLIRLLVDPEMMLLLQSVLEAL